MESSHSELVQSFERLNELMVKVMPYLVAGLIIQHLDLFLEAEKKRQEEIGLITSVQGDKMFFGSQGISIIAERPKFK